MSTPDPRKVEYLPLSSLKADPRNPKAHDQDTIDASIGRFGVLDLIVKDERTGYIVSGHGRKKSLVGMMKRGESAPEGVKVDPESGEWLVPVVTGWASRTDAEAGAALIALNRTTELGGWVDDALLELLDDLSEVEDGLEGVGFDDMEVEDLRSRLDESDEDFETLLGTIEGGRSTGINEDGSRTHDGYRTMVLNLEVEAFVWLTDRLKAQAKVLGSQSNSETIVRLVALSLGEEPPASNFGEGDQGLGIETFEQEADK